MSDTRVYFIGSARSKAVKIGVSDDPRKRLMSMQTGSAQRLCLLAEMPGDERYEKALHRFFAEYRVRGEWFRNEGRLAQFIAMLPVMEMLNPPKKRTPKQKNALKPTKEEIEKIHRDVARIWQPMLVKLRGYILRYGVDEFAKLVKSKRSIVIRSIYERGLRFRLEWLFYVYLFISQSEAIDLLTPWFERMGFRLLTPEQAEQEAKDAIEYQELRDTAIATLGPVEGRRFLAAHDADCAAEIARREAASA